MVPGEYSDRPFGVSGDSSRSYFMGSISECLNAVLAGWARDDPKAAWATVSDPKGRVTKLSDDGGYGYLAPIRIFEALSRVDPASALAEFKKHPNLLYRGSMLKGMSRGLPEGFEWQKFFEEVLASKGSNHDQITWVLRENLFARWMQDDAKGAIEWFRSEPGKVISIEEVTIYEGGGGDPFATDYVEPETKKVRREVSLGFAIWKWVERDFEGASKWLRKNPEFLDQVVGQESRLRWSPESLEPKTIRKLLVATMNQAAREKLVLELLVDGKVSILFSIFGAESGVIISPSGTKALEGLQPEDTAQLKREISELKISEELSQKLLKAHLGGHNDDDPFSNE